MRNSLIARTFLTASGLSVVVLLVAGVVLVTMYRGALVRSFDKRLEVYVKTLIGESADIEDDSDTLVDPGNLGEPRFGFPLSGWYWAIVDAKSGRLIHASRSLQGETLEPPGGAASAANRRPGMTHRDLTGPNGQALRLAMLEFSISEQDSFRALVAGDTMEIAEEIQIFGGQVAATLFLLGLGLVLTSFFQVRYGLRPLRRIRKALVAIRSGRASTLRGRFPDEIQPLVNEMNALIGSNREILDRSRTQVGNLAHALKTPLSILRNEAERNRGEFADKVSEQAETMGNHVSLYLDRARFAAKRNIIGVATEVQPILDRLERAMAQLHQDKDLRIESVGDEPLHFRGEKEDFEEMVGNLLDNACKWADQNVRIDSRGKSAEDGRRRITIAIDDDGPGLSEEQAKQAMGRGERLDSSIPGSGLGLSIVSELANSYGGSISLGPSPLGGLRCELDLPAAQM